MHYDAGRVRAFVAAVFRAHDVPAHESDLVADVLVSADLRGIRSHGVARLPYFSVRLQNGVIAPAPDMTVDDRSPTTCAIDAANGLGIVASRLATERVIAMARDHGSGFATVTHSNHFGYAGYWAMRIAEHGMIGIAMANSGRRVTPTFGVESLLGTNPIAVALPGGEDGSDFVLDMATSTVAVGKIETALREDRSLPDGWVSSDGATPALDENGTLDYAAPLLPLGGEGDTAGGHKGYGLSLMVELLCGALAGTPLAARLSGAGGAGPSEMGQFFGAIRIDGFRSLTEVQSDMDATFETLRGATRAPGHDRIYVHGEPEVEAERANLEAGLPITPALLAQMHRLDEQLQLGFDFGSQE